MAEAGEVWFIWGVNGWQMAPEAIRPPGTVIKDKLIHTPMVREGDTFAVKLSVQAGVTIDYGYLITMMRDGGVVRIWQDDDGKDFHKAVMSDGVAAMKSTVSISRSRSTTDQSKSHIPDAKIVTEEFRYQMAEAGEVWLVWGIDGWQLVPDAIRPPGTVVKDKLLHTPMDREGDIFSAKVMVPPGAVIDYGFLITKTRSGFTIRVWDGADAFHKRAMGKDRTEIKNNQTLAMIIRPKAPTALISPSTPLLTQEFRYQMAEAGEVWLVWGIDGWQLVPDAIRPPGTVVKDDLMNSPMVLEGDSFVVRTTIPKGSTVDYGFWIEKTHTGSEIKLFDSNEEFHKKVTEHGVTAVSSAVKLSPELSINLYLVIGISVALTAALIIMLNRGPFWNRPWAIPSGLVVLTLVGLALRLWAVSGAERLLGGEPVLGGDELGYDYMAHSLLLGNPINWPCRTPLYPLLLATSYWIFGHSFSPVLYAQAFVGASVIPITFLIARRFTSDKSSLLAAGIIALHPALIQHVTRLYTEVLYTPLLMLTVLTLLQALDTPSSGRFALGGAVLSLTNLCRPTAAIFPLFLPLLPIRNVTFWRKLALWVVYGGVMVAMIAPWSYHNYLTYHKFLPLSVTTAVLWQGSPEYYHLMESGRPYTRIWNENLNPNRNGGLDVCTINGDQYFTERAFSSIREEPLVYIIYVMKKIAFFWIGHPAADWPSYAIFSADAMRPYYSQPQIIGIFASRLFPFIALIALLSLYGRLTPFVPLLLVCGYFTLVHSIMYGEVRHSEPLHPLLATIIATAISHWSLVVSRHRQGSAITSEKEMVQTRRLD